MVSSQHTLYGLNFNTFAILIRDSHVQSVFLLRITFWLLHYTTVWDSLCRMRVGYFWN